MRRAAWQLSLLTFAFLTACAGPPDDFSPPRYTSGLIGDPRAEARTDDDFSLSTLVPSKGDVIGVGGSLLGNAAAGIPGGAVLGFGGQVAGGNRFGKAVGSTIGALFGALLGPVGSIFGGMIGGYAGDEVHRSADEPRPKDVDIFADGELHSLYVEGIDRGT